MIRVSDSRKQFGGGIYQKQIHFSEFSQVLTQPRMRCLSLAETEAGEGV